MIAPDVEPALPLGHSFSWSWAGTVLRPGLCGWRPPISNGEPCNKTAEEHRTRQTNYGCAWCSTTAGMNVRCSCTDACAAAQCPMGIDDFDHTTIPVPTFERRAA